MSRFPLLPLLLSFSTTLQSACLEDKCALTEFKDKTECKTDKMDIGDHVVSMGPIRSYVYDKNGAEITVDSIGMIDANKFVNNAEYIAEIALLIKYKDSSKDKSELIIGSLQKMCGDSCVLNATTIKSDEGDMDQRGQMSVSNLGVQFVMSDVFCLYKWGSPTSEVKTQKKENGKKYYSLSSDINDRIYVVIDNNPKQNIPNPALLISGAPMFDVKDLNNEAVLIGKADSKKPNLVLVGNFHYNSFGGAPQLIVWDDSGAPIGTLSIKTSDGAYLLDRDTSANILNYNGSIPNTKKSEGSNTKIIPIAIGDLDKNGLSDLVVAETDDVKKTFTIAAYYNNIGVFFRRNLFETNNTPPIPVQAIAVSIPNGDDPPKLVWATSTFKPTTEKSPTGTNTITINVLPIQK